MLEYANAMQEFDTVALIALIKSKHNISVPTTFLFLDVTAILLDGWRRPCPTASGRRANGQVYLGHKSTILVRLSLFGSHGTNTGRRLKTKERDPMQWKRRTARGRRSRCRKYSTQIAPS